MTIKYFAIVLIIAALFASACSKKNTAKPGNTTDTTKTGTTTKAYLPVSVYVSSTSDTNKKLLYTLSYDDKNRIVRNTFGANDTIGYSYDDKNRMIEQDQYDTHHVIFFKRTYAYPSDTVVTVTSYRDGVQVNQYGLIMHNGLIVKDQVPDVNHPVPDNVYDAHGNLIKWGIYTYTYDNAKSPFSMVVGYRPFFVFDDFGFTYPGNNVNNKLTNPLNQWTITYNFNNDGMPTRMRVVQTGFAGVYYYWYNYLVK